MKTYPCPHCQTLLDITEKTPYRPFCSERCRLIDLGAWASEEYQIEGKSPTAESGEPEIFSDEPTEWTSADKLH